MNNVLVFVALTAILVFMVLYYSMLHPQSDFPEKFNTTTSPVLQVIQEINENVVKFNQETSSATANITNAFSDMRRNVDNISFDTSSSVQGMRNELLHYSKLLSDMDKQYVKPDALQRYMPETQVKDAIARNDTLLRSELASKRYVEGSFVPINKLDDLVTDMTKRTDQMGMDIVGLNSRQVDMQNKLTSDYASREWVEKDFAPMTDMKTMRSTQDIIFKDFAKKADITEYQSGVQSSQNKMAKDVAEWKEHVNVQYVTHTGLKDKLEQQYTPLELHNNVSSVVNDTLVTLNESLMKTIQRDGDAATHAKLLLIEDQVNNMTHTVDNVHNQVQGITANTIDRDELVLGKFRLSGVEQGDMIRLFNRDKTSLSGGILAKSLESQNSLVSGGTTTLRGPLNIGTTSNRPILVKGQANVEVNVGSVLLLDKNAQHRVDGTMTIDKLNANNLVIGKTVLNPDMLDTLQSKIKKMEDRLDMMAVVKQNSELPVVVVYENINAQGAFDNIHYSVEEIDIAWQDRIACIVLSPGIKVTIYSQPRYGGSDTRTISNYRMQPMTLNLMDYPLSNSATKTWDRAVKSIRIEKL